MVGFRRGRYLARFAETPQDVERTKRLRNLCFRGTEDGLDQDQFDDTCRHVMVEDIASGDLICCFRLLPFENGTTIGGSYAAQFYDLDLLQAFDGRMVEMGRFCVHPDVMDPDVLRVAWAAMTEYVDSEQVELLFGCSSFKGTEAEAYMDAFALLKERHLAPKRWLPRVKAPRVFRFAAR
ncbi:MAG: GNAT family N-acetyltransferase, partial [Pseudomonadota bacterium]